MGKYDQVDFGSMTDDELAEWHYAHKDELDAELARGDVEPVEMEISPSVQVTRSFRLAATDARLIDSAAERAGLSRSEWIRLTLVSAAQPDAQPQISDQTLRKVVSLLRSAESLVEPAVRNRKVS